MLTRAQHLEWCKTRALEYVELGDLRNAFASMASDLRKHPETAGHPGMEIGHHLMFLNLIKTPEQMRAFIDGIN